MILNETAQVLLAFLVILPPKTAPELGSTRACKENFAFDALVHGAELRDLQLICYPLPQLTNLKAAVTRMGCLGRLEENGEAYFHADSFSLKIRVYTVTLLGSLGKKDFLKCVSLSLTRASFPHSSFPTLPTATVDASRGIAQL